MPKNKEAAPAVEAAGNKAAAGSALVRAASWSDFVVKPAANKASSASTIKPAAKVEGKTKQAAKVEGKTKQAAKKVASACSIEPAAKAEGKTKKAANKLASASSIEPAAKAEGKPKREPAARVEGKPEPAVISSGIETVSERFIYRLRTWPMRRPDPLPEELRKRNPRLVESTRATDAMLNEIIDLYEHILRQHDEKGFAQVWVEHLDNGLKNWFRLPEEGTA